MVVQENDIPEEASDVQGARVIDRRKRGKKNKIPGHRTTVPAETNST